MGRETKTGKRRYWIGVVSKAHVHIGAKGGFAQANHGKSAPLKRMHQGDGLVFYSPRQSYPEGEVLQAFTAIGTIKSGEVYQVDMGDGFMPYRIDVDYLTGREAPIKPLIEKLTFISNKKSWGAALRFGHLEIPEEDFKTIAESMGVDL
jgi:hypothetical protein